MLASHRRQTHFVRVANPDDLQEQISRLASNKNSKQFAQLGKEFQVPASEALLFTNSEEFHRDYLTSGHVKQLQDAHDPRQAIEMATWSILSRAPTEEEFQLLETYLSERKDRPQQAYQQLVWSLICSSEFRFNY